MTLKLLSTIAYASISLAQAPTELVEPPVCSTLRADHSSTPFCKVVDRPGGSGIKDIQLTLEAAQKPVQVGGYQVTSQAYNGMYIPPLVETSPGSVLNINLVDSLPAAAAPGDHMAGHTNIHTHGLIVSPQNETSDTGRGDNILVDLQNGGSFSYSIPIPTALATGVLDNDKPIEHPDGLYWYHPHLHGLAKQQVSGGMGGVISIGRGLALLTVNGPNGKTDASATKVLRDRTDVRYLELKDMQLKTAIAPGDATGSSPGDWNADYDPGFCGNVDLSNVSNGYYRQAGAGSPFLLWLFTINGQRYPRISIGAGRNHLWRIANLSATVTYIIELLDQGTQVSFEVINVDGVVAGGSAAQGGSVASIRKTTLLLMPAGRAEILVRNDGSNPGPERNLVLRTHGFNTGPDGGTGDTWPTVNLAEVHLAKTEPAFATPVRSLMPITSTVMTKSGGLVAGAPGVTAASPPPAHTPGKGCKRPILDQGEWRQITLSQDDTNFFIASQISKSGSPPSNQIQRASFPMGGFDWDKDHVCVALGRSEIWEIDNTASELHNFHLHQTKFRLARPDELEKLGLPGKPVVDPTDRLNKLGINFSAETTKGSLVWHDTLPVPYAADKSNPGKIFIVINFRAPEQIGRYVFHCHILEHEDKGMMAPFEVLRPKK